MRTVIKINPESTNTDEKKQNDKTTTQQSSEKNAVTKSEQLKTKQATSSQTPDLKDDLEQNKNILQNIKDFSFQIKKNQEDITGITEKINTLTKDLDDLVSLYEIVSEQMNPFVGLSKVTKKRLDALENFTKEIETLNTRMSEIEVALENNSFPIKNTIQSPEVANPISNKPDIPQPNYTNNPQIQTMPPNAPPQGVQQQPEQQAWDAWSDEEIEIIINNSLQNLIADQSIDTMINDLLLTLK